MKFQKSHLFVGYLALTLSLPLTLLSAFPDSPETPETWLTNIAEISEQVKATPNSPRKNQAQIDTSLRTIKMSLAAEDYQQAISQLNTLRNLEPKAVKPILALSEKLIDLLVQKSKNEIARTEKLYEEFAQAVLVAKTPNEIDPWLKKLNVEVKKAQTQNRAITPLKLWTPSISNSPYATGYNNINRSNQLFNMNTSSLAFLQSKASQALQIAHYWQDYLHYKNSGEISTARNSMSNISRVVVNFTYIPRSKVLELQSGLALGGNGKNSITKLTIDDLKQRLGTQQDALLLHQELSQTSSSYLTPAIRSLNSKLRDYSQACEYLEGGDIDDGFYKIRSLIYHPIIGSLSKKTHDKFLSRYLKIPANFKQNDNEESEAWATRYILKLSADKDWKKLHVALVFMHQYYYRSGGGSKAPINQDLEAVRNLLTGMNYEANQQYVRAIVAYRQVLGSIGLCTEVVAESGKHLTKLQKAHPAEYAQSQSLHSHDSTSSSYTTSPLLIRKIVKEELSKKDQPVEKAEE